MHLLLLFLHHLYVLNLHLLLHHALFSFNDPSTTHIYTLSLHDALPICCIANILNLLFSNAKPTLTFFQESTLDRKSTRLNSSHVAISYAVVCLKKKIMNFL